MALEDLSGQHIHLPHLPIYPADRFINTSPDVLERLSGQVVLVDFWDYTCINCIRTLPYIKEWHARYQDKGLVLLGVHSPEFAFEKEKGNLEAAVKRFDLKHPIIADNDFEIWRLFGNKYWPAKYLFDKDGILRTYHFGEGGYGEFEAAVQKLLLERDPSLELPPPVEPVRKEDMPGAVCYPVTPETYIGFARARVGNVGGLAPNRVKNYILPERLKDDVLYLEGPWDSEAEYAHPAQGPASMHISYQAAEVNLVINAGPGEAFKVYVEQDGAPLEKGAHGDDVRGEDGEAVVLVEAPRMYNLVRNKEFGRHHLKLTSDSSRFRAHAFTFVSTCQ